MLQYNQCSKRYWQDQEYQLSQWHFSQGQRGHNGKFCPLAGCHPKQLQAQKLIVAAKPPSVSSWRRHNVLQGTKAAETRGMGHRDINMREAAGRNETRYTEACFYLGCLHTWKSTLLSISTVTPGSGIPTCWHEHLCLESCCIVLHDPLLQLHFSQTSRVLSLMSQHFTGIHSTKARDNKGNGQVVMAKTLWTGES